MKGNEDLRGGRGGGGEGEKIPGEEGGKRSSGEMWERTLGVERGRQVKILGGKGGNRS